VLKGTWFLQTFSPSVVKKKTHRIAIYCSLSASVSLHSNKADWETVPRYQYFIKNKQTREKKNPKICRKLSVHISYWFRNSLLCIHLMLVSKHQGFYEMDRTLPTWFIFQCAREYRLVFILGFFLLKNFCQIPETSCYFNLHIM